MKKGINFRIIGGTAALLAAAALVLAVFSLMSVTDKNNEYLADTRGSSHGWRYELLDSDGARAYEPSFSEDGRMLELPEDIGAVRITRTMTEDIPFAELQWVYNREGIDVLMDGELLYTDFPLLDRDADGFAHPDREQLDRLIQRQGGIWSSTSISLPTDYLGRELSVITYFHPDGARLPEFPFLGNEDSDVASYIVYSVKSNVIMTVYALLALLMAGVFLVDARNRNWDGRTPLLCLYFLMLFLKEAYISEAGYFSALTERLDLRFLTAVYMAPLYLYLVLRIKTKWKWPLCGAVAAWAVYESARELIRLRRDPDTAGIIGPAALVVLLAVAAALCVDGLRRGKRTRQEKKRLLIYGLIAAGVTGLYLLDRARVWEGLGSYLRDGVWLALSMGNCWPLVTLSTDITSYVTVIVVSSEVIRRTLGNMRTMEVLGERSRQTMVNYEQLLAAEDDTRALHHELRHHMTALSAILADGDIDRARRYADAVAGDLEHIPAGRYSQNILVNVVAGSYLDRARAQGIQVEHYLNVPRTLNIADDDLSVFLSNMLQNALEACQRMQDGERRYIWVDMHLRGNFLCVQCANSAPAGEEIRERPGHGYGLAAMRAVAEKYNSVLLIERTPGEFSVLSDFCLEEES